MVYMIPNQNQWCFGGGFVLFRVTCEYSIFFSVSVTHLFIRSAFWPPDFHTNDVNHWLLLLLVCKHAVFKCFSWAIIIVIFWILLRIDFFFCILNQIFLINIPRFVNIFLSFSMMVYCCLPRRSDGAFFFCKFLVLKSHTLISIKCWSEKYFFWLINVLSHQWSFRTELFSKIPQFDYRVAARWKIKFVADLHSSRENFCSWERKVKNLKKSSRNTEFFQVFFFLQLQKLHL